MLKRKKKKNQKTHPKTQKIWSVTTGKTDAESALQMIFHLTFPLTPPCRLPCSLCTQPHRTQPPSSGKHLIHKKHGFTTLSKLPERMYLPTQHCLSEAQKKSDFKGSLNWNVAVSKVSSGFRFNKLLLHSSLLTVWPETIPGNSSKPSTITL